MCIRDRCLSGQQADVLGFDREDFTFPGALKGVNLRIALAESFPYLQGFHALTLFLLQTFQFFRVTQNQLFPAGSDYRLLNGPAVLRDCVDYLLVGAGVCLRLHGDGGVGAAVGRLGHRLGGRLAVRLRIGRGLAR